MRVTFPALDAITIRSNPCMAGGIRAYPQGLLVSWRLHIPQEPLPVDAAVCNLRRGFIQFDFSGPEPSLEFVVIGSRLAPVDRLAGGLQNQERHCVEDVRQLLHEKKSCALIRIGRLRKVLT